MKRLILLSMMLISTMIRGDDTSPTPVTNQSSSNNIDISISNIHHINLDNTEIDSGGNWLNKRIWYERSQKMFDEIRVLVSTVTELRIQFSNEVNAVGQKIDTFFETVSFEQGELDDKFKEILVALEQKQKLVGDLVEEERTLQASVKETLPAVGQIEKNMKLLGEIDKKIDQTFLQACKTIDECREYETKSWDAFKTIAKELDDKKARNLYYQMNNYKENIDQKCTYLKSTLLPYLHNVLVAKIEKNIIAINSSIATLKTKGLDLEKIMKKNQEDDVTELQKREKQAADIAVRKALEEEQSKAKIIAEKAERDLEEANKKSFSNVVNGYYDAIFGKIIRFLGIDRIQNPLQSYTFPLATNLYSISKALQSYMHDLVAYVMSYFNVRSTKNQIDQTVNQSQTNIKLQTDAASLASSKTIEEEQKNVTSSDKIVDSVDVASNKDVVLPTANQQVVVQSLSTHQHDAYSNKTVDAYHLFKLVLDFITTIIMSIYTCFIHFLKLLFNFSMYVTLSN